MNFSTFDKLINSFAAPVLFGVLAFWLIVGLVALQPENIAWLQGGDPSQAFLGWRFFRQSPWGWPLGANPAYGMEVSSSIFYSDSIPLMALAFKLLSPLLSEPFQYVGLWLLTCFVLQGFFGWKLTGLLTENGWLRILGTGFFLFTPSFLWRLHGHYTLCAHWFILAGIYLYATPPGKKLRWGWPLLLLCASLAHSYLLAMAAALWTADLTRRSILKETETRALLAEIGISLLLVIVALWQAGFFMVKSGLVTGGFGLYRMNILSPLDADGWSYLLKDLPGGIGDYEGFNFFGLGVLCLLLMIIPTLPRAPWRIVFNKRWLPLSVMSVGLTLFAITHHIGVGAYDYTLPLPKPVVDAFGMFRSSGRMFWPVFYILLTAGLWLCINQFGDRLAITLCAGLLAVQIFDLSSVWSSFQTKFSRQGTEWRTTLTTPFWNEAARRYKHVRIAPAGDIAPVWDNFVDIVYFAAAHNLSIDSVYLARLDGRKVRKSKQQSEAVIESGHFDRNSLYILRNEAQQIVAASRKPEDLLTNIDGFWVLAPGWDDCLSCNRLGLKSMAVDERALTVSLDQNIFFGTSGTGKQYLRSGWSNIEDWGVWSSDKTAVLLLILSDDIRSGFRLQIQARAFLPPNQPTQTVQCWINGKLAGTLVFEESNNLGWRSILAPKDLFSDLGRRLLKMELRVANPVSPQSVGVSDDPRLLGIGLVSIKITP